MNKKRFVLSGILFGVLCMAIPATGQLTGTFDLITADEYSQRDFPLVTDTCTADLLVDAGDSKTVLLAARLFSEDVERVTGRKSMIKTTVDNVSGNCVIAGSWESLFQKLRQ